MGFLRRLFTREKLRVRPASCLRFRPAVEPLEDRFLPVLQPLGSLPAPIQEVFHGDFDGDRNQDVAGFTSDGHWVVSLAVTPNGSTPPSSFAAPATWANWSIAPAWKQLFVADFNTDGRDDVAGFGFNGKWFVGLSDGTQFTTGVPWAQWSVSSTWAQLFVGNFNGDFGPPTGRPLPDVAGFDSTGKWWVGLSNGGGTFATGPPWAQWSVPSSWHQLFVANFNAQDSIGGAGIFDSRDDVAGFGFNGQWHVGLSFGNGFLLAPAWAQWSPPLAWRQLFVGNFSGTLSADIAGFDVTGKWWVGRSISTGLAGSFQTGPSWAQWSPAEGWSALVIGDFKRDGKLDVAGLAFNGTWWVGLANDLGTQFATSAAPWATWSSPGTWSAFLVANFNHYLRPPTEDHPFVEEDINEDVAGLAFNGTWWLGLTQLSDQPTRFITSSQPWTQWP